MARPTHVGRVSHRGHALAVSNILASAAEIIAGHTRGAPLTPADVRALRATIKLLEETRERSLNASRSPAVWRFRLELESVARPARRMR